MSSNLSLIQGNEAIVLGAIKAGVNFYGGYPITPSSEIMHNFALRASKDKELVFFQFEDEIASICGVIGAALVGAKAMTATSGPGFSLMQEGIGFAHMANVPLLIINVQRVGPATGMPTLPSQGDILQAYHGCHGDYISIVFAPATVEECYFLTIKAVNLSQELMMPVILLSDAFLGHLYETVDLKKYDSVEIKKSEPIFSGNKTHVTGLLNDKGKLKTQDSKFYYFWLEERKKHINKIIQNYELDDYYENKKSRRLIISYGSMARFIKKFKDDFAIYRPMRLFPVIEERLLKISNQYDEIICAEMNDGQYASIIEQAIKRPVKRIKLLGGDLDINYLEEQLKKL